MKLIANSYRADCRGRVGAALVLLVLLAGGRSPGHAQDEPLPSFDDYLSIAIAEPSDSQPRSGPTRFAATLYPENAPVNRVIFYVDGRAVGERREPPYEITVDLGSANREHSFLLVVEREGLDDLEASITTGAITVDEEISLELQQLYVTVTGGSGPALNLTAADFTVLDDSEPQEIVTFEGGDVPLAASLVIDSSASMEGARLEAALAGAKSFVDGMRELDEASILLFCHELLRLVPFTSDPEELRRGLSAITAKGNTAINDHLYLALKQLDGRQGRRVVVLLSDGADLHSVLGMEDVIWKARRSQAVLYWIRLSEGEESFVPFNTAWRDFAGNEREYNLVGRAVEETGGRIVEVDDVSQIQSAFDEIMNELREQYVIGYYPSNLKGDGAWHKVKIRLSKSGLRVRTRDGYIDF